MSDVKDAIRNEQTILRSELQELKKCQIQYFLISIGATGVIFGFGKELLEAVKEGSLLYLTPLMIILPCWLTFFDKANTITRLTGYVRVFIESQLKKEKPDYFGYENSLSKFRQLENAKVKITTKSGESIRSIINLTRNQYWKISWLTFFFLSVTCFLYPYFKFNNFSFLNDHFARIEYKIFLSVEVISCYIAMKILRRLLFGKYSYEHVTKFWLRVYEELREQ